MENRGVNGLLQLEYTISVVISVYQVKQFIHEAIDSVIHQDIGLKHIQLIIVDDGSTDGSGEICDQYKTKYPNNIFVIHKENGGVSSAKNEGLKYVQGRYVNFLDPDDYIDRDAFRKVVRFMDGVGEKCDICCIPMYFFGNKKGGHTLNNKFKQGTRVIDLEDSDNRHCLLLSNANAFYRTEAARKLHFDTRLTTAEDAKENLRLLLDNPLLGVVADTKYHYRKHGNSAIDKSQRNKPWYIPYMENFAIWGLEEARKRFGIIPVFVQQMIMYNLQWKLEQEHIPDNVLTEEEKDKYRELVLSAVSHIDEEIIMNQKSLSHERKLYAIREKRRIEEEQGRISARYEVDFLTEAKTEWSFLTIERERGRFSIEGYHLFPSDIEQTTATKIIVNGVEHLTKHFARKDADQYWADIKIFNALGFRKEFDLKEETEVSFSLLIENKPVIRKQVVTGDLFPISLTYRSSYAFDQGFLILNHNQNILIKQRLGSFQRWDREISLIKELLSCNKVRGVKYTLARLYFYWLKTVQRNRIALVSEDVLYESYDNLLKRFSKDNNDISLMLISDRSRKNKSEKRIKGFVSPSSPKHKLLFLLCGIYILKIDSVKKRFLPFDVKEEMKGLYVRKNYWIVGRNKETRWLIPEYLIHKGLISFVGGTEENSTNGGRIFEE